jgi:Dockerin type I domain
MSGNVSYCSNPTPAPVPGVAMRINGFTFATTDSSGNYSFFNKGEGGWVTASKAALSPGSPGINTIDVVAVQRHFLIIGPPLSGCRLTAADVNGDGSINTTDVVAIQRFFLGFSTGIANVGKYQFNPQSRCFVAQPNQDFDTLIFGDVATPFIY